jgi:hypothetical protein
MVGSIAGFIIPDFTRRFALLRALKVPRQFPYLLGHVPIKAQKVKQNMK